MSRWWTGLLLAAAAAHTATLPLWREPAQPQRYLEASGRRSAFLGRADGTFEAWIFPVKVLHDLRLLFQIEGDLDRAPAAPFAARTEVTPAAATLIYSHAAFTVRQTLWAPHEQPALVMDLEVAASRPVTVFVQFRPDLKLMWPAAIGGQYGTWLADEQAMLLAEPTNRVAALIASPSFEAFSEEVGHMLPDQPITLRLRTFPAGDSRATIVLAGGPGDRQAAREVYRRVRDHLSSFRQQLDEFWIGFLSRTARLETPDPVINRAFLWGKIALEKGFACNDGLGCGLVAGYGPSGLSERPGFGWYFGGDAFMNIPALLDYGDFRGARTALEFLRARQRSDGKMMHEMTMSAAFMGSEGREWFRLPYAYYHADTTPWYLVAARAYVARSDDREFLEQSWSSLKQAFEYCLGTTDQDGLMSNRKAGMAAVETGALRGRVEKDIFLQGVWLAALEAMADLAERKGDAALARLARKQHEAARAALSAWWVAERGHFAFGVLTDHTRLDALTAWPAVALALADLPEDKARPAADALSRPELSTDWGVRLVASDASFYNPLGYNDGSVWPFMTGFTTLAQYRHHRAYGAFQHLAATAALTGFAGPGYVPENFSGDRCQTLPRAVPHQLFSTGVGVVQALITGMLGLSADASRRAIRLVPHLPPHWDVVRLKGYRVGEDSFDFELRQRPGRLSLAVELDGAGPYELTWSPALPPGSPAAGVVTDRDLHPSLSRRVDKRAELSVEFTPGLELLSDVPSLEPGDVSGAVRLVAGGCDARTCRFTVAAPGGAPGRLRYRLRGEEREMPFEAPGSEREFATVELRLDLPAAP